MAIWVFRPFLEYSHHKDYQRLAANHHLFGPLSRWLTVRPYVHIPEEETRGLPGLSVS
jgi:hypothetical protein